MRHPGHLTLGFPVPIKTKPPEPQQNFFLEFRFRPLPVRVFDAEKKFTVLIFSVEVIKKGCPHTADVQMSRR
jgi:hypothetical protein